MSASVGACLGCEGRCCKEYIVPVSGYDVWRIVQAQRLAPTTFVQREPEDVPTPAGFLLRPGGQTFTIALRRQYDRRNERPCVFLMQLREGVQRCGIYADRPRVCQTYPMYRKAHSVVPRDDMLCPAGSWAGIFEQPGEWRERVLEQDAEWEQYEVVVQVWNRTISQRSPDSGYVLEQFLAYLVAAYDLIAPLDADAPDLARVAVELSDLAQHITAEG